MWKSEWYQYLLSNHKFKLDSYCEQDSRDKQKSPRLDKSVRTMKQLIELDIKRKKNNQLYDRRLDQHLTGPKGLEWQHQQELQRLHKHEIFIGRGLPQVHREETPTRRTLPPIIEEEVDFSSLETSTDHLPSIRTRRSPVGPQFRSVYRRHFWLEQYRFPQNIAKNSQSRFSPDQQKTSLHQALRH